MKTALRWLFLLPGAVCFILGYTVGVILFFAVPGAVRAQEDLESLGDEMEDDE